MSLVKAGLWPNASYRSKFKTSVMVTSKQLTTKPQNQCCFRYFIKFKLKYHPTLKQNNKI